MLYLPDEYTKALEEVLNQNLDRQALDGRKGKAFIERIARTVATISQGLTKERGRFLDSAYLNDRAIQEAYLTYYTSTNLLKLWPPLRELARSGFIETKKSINHLDIGTGTGAALWGLASYLHHEQPQVTTISSHATDSLRANLTATERFHSIFRKQVPMDLALRTSQWDIAKEDAPLTVRDQSYDLITLMNVVNEIDPAHDDRILRSLFSVLNDGGAIVMIEPSTKRESRRALEFRDRLLEAGAFVYAPCTKSGGCPALIDEDNWCHTEVQWQRPDFIRAIDDIAGTLRLSLKFTYGVFLREDSNLSDFALGKRDFFEAGRIVSQLFNEKGRARFFLCNERGRNEYVWNKRDKNKENSAILGIERYDLVQIAGVEVREKDIKVTESGVVNILSGSGGCGNVDN